MVIEPNTAFPEKVGLVLSGGGARAAYQVGALKAISEILPFTTHQNPFRIITGTSAGAINATVVAAYSQHFKLGMKRLENVWANFHCEQVYRCSFKELMLHSGRWVKLIFGIDPNKSIGLLNNEPLAELLSQVIPYPLIAKAIEQDALDAVCITASSYTSGESVSFYQGKAELEPWIRHRRNGVATQIEKQHLLASAAIPLVFPAVTINHKYFGDGSMRFLSPLSPALHLGAEKVLVIGVDPINVPEIKTSHPKGYPTIAEIAGHLLDSVFIDSLDSDLERLHRINRTVAKIPEKVRLKEGIKLKSVDTFVLNPSEDISLIARRYFKSMPKALQFFLKRVGISDESGDTVLSYLLFEKPFTRTLINLGYKDAMNKSDELLRFYGLKATSTL